MWMNEASGHCRGHMAGTTTLTTWIGFAYGGDMLAWMDICAGSSANVFAGTACVSFYLPFDFN